jgi:uncharacterized repeat protein (TIGR01451 family)
MNMNLDNLTKETVYATVTVDVTGDSEFVRLKETGPDTGIFAGYIPSGNGQSATPNNGALTLTIDSKIEAAYTDDTTECSGDTAVTDAKVDPFGIIFDSSNGDPVDGALVTLIDTSSGLPAAVFCEDDTTPYPFSIISGGEVNGICPDDYDFPSGGYRFPSVASGDYRIEVTPPSGYVYRSTVLTAILQLLPGAPFAIVNGSRGEDFTLTPGPALEIDIPLDPSSSGMWLTKYASKDVAGIGDFIRYSLEIENLTASPLLGVNITDRLPLGFMYQSGSLRVDGEEEPDPEISSNGRVLTIPIGFIPTSTTVKITYVVEIASGAKYGKSTNVAVASSFSGFTSNTAKSTVVVKDDLFRRKSFIVGRVIVDNCDDEPVEENDGVEGIRIYLEDGTYALTDDEGKYHFEGVEPGVHVVQLDIESVPEKYWIVPCEENSRFAGRSFSQFVDLQGGTMWRADFHFSLKPKVRGKLDGKTCLSYEEGDLQHSILISSSRVPVHNLRLSVVLPDGVSYIKGSSSIEGMQLPDPTVQFGVMTYRFDEILSDEKVNVQFITDKTVKADDLKTVVTFDTPSEKNQRLILNGEKRSLTETIGLLPGEKWEEPLDETLTNIIPQYFEDKWLNSAAPGLDILWPPEGHYPEIRSTSIIVKHDPEVKFTLLQNGREANRPNYDGLKKNTAGSVAVSQWSGLDLSAGDNIFEFITYDEGGNKIEMASRKIYFAGPPVKAELIEDGSFLLADGITNPILSVRLYDKNG